MGFTVFTIIMLYAVLLFYWRQFFMDVNITILGLVWRSCVDLHRSPFICDQLSVFIGLKSTQRSLKLRCTYTFTVGDSLECVHPFNKCKSQKETNVCLVSVTAARCELWEPRLPFCWGFWCFSSTPWMCAVNHQSMHDCFPTGHKAQFIISEI